MSKNIIFIPYIRRDNRSKTYNYSIKSWEHFCAKHDCELLLLEDLLLPIEEMRITWQRYYIFDLLEANNIDYDQVAMIDADTIVHPDCPNFFNIVNYKYGGVVNLGSQDWILRSIENYKKYIFNNTDTTVPYYQYINGGFQIFNKSHKEFFKKVLDFYFTNKDNLIEMQSTFHTGTDQTPINYLLQQEKIDVEYLPYEFNMCDMNRFEILGEDLLFTKIGWIYHFNAIPDNKDSIRTHYFMISFTDIPDKTEFKDTTSLKFKQDVAEFFKDKNLNTCLEIGTNKGWTTRILSDLFKEVHTVDYTLPNTEAAKFNNSKKSNIHYYTADAYKRETFAGMPKMDVVFIDCVHTYDAVLFDINTALSLIDTEQGMYFLFDDYGHPESTGVKQAILQAIEEGLKIETYVGQPAGYQYNSATTTIDHEGIILSYGK